MVRTKSVILFQSDFIREVKVPPASSDLAKGQHRKRSPTVTIRFISLSAAQYNLETDWAEMGVDVTLRRCQFVHRIP